MGNIWWALGAPQLTNAAGDRSRGGRSKLHAFQMTPGQVELANEDVVWNVEPVCRNKRWIGAVGPCFEPGEIQDSRCCVRCLRSCGTTSG